MVSLISLFLHVWLLQASAAGASEAKPLPQLETFLQSIRAKLHPDRVLLDQYTYTERIFVQRLDGNGKAKKALESREYEVYPSLEPGGTYRKLISKNGQPLSAEDAAKRDREYEKKHAEMLRKIDRETADDKRRREEKEAKKRLKEEESIEEAFRLYQITMLGREQVDGRPAIALAFEPRPKYKSRTEDGKILAKVRGRALFDEEDCELIRLDVEMVNNLSIGLGFVAKVKRGTRMLFERRKLNNEIYLPALTRIYLKGRFLLFVGMNMEIESAYSNYKKFSVETSVQYGTAKKP